jgi:hypothetical protein
LRWVGRAGGGRCSGEAIGVARVGRWTYLRYKARRNGPCGLTCGVPASRLCGERETEGEAVVGVEKRQGAGGRWQGL